MAATVPVDAQRHPCGCIDIPDTASGSGLRASIRCWDHREGRTPAPAPERPDLLAYAGGYIIGGF